MTISLNGSPITYTLENEKTIGEVLGAIESLCKQENETVIAVYVDEKELTTEELDVLFTQSVHNNHVIELRTVSGVQVCAYMQELVTLLTGYIQEFEKISVYMQTNEEGKVLALLQQFSEKLNELYRCFLLFDITGIPVDILIEGRQVHEYQKDIAAFLQDIISAIEENDIIQVGDIAEYELSPLVKTLLNGVSYILV
ncbi:MAG: hypothetical protein ACTTH8_01860 [Treponema sp.]